MTAANAAQSITEPASQDSLVAAMMRPEFYPKPPVHVTHKETHISHIFFAGDLVFKVKKTIRFSFLDYSSLVKRRHYLQEELRLNRRLAPSVYLGVMPIAFDTSGWRLGGWAEPGEYTLVMRRLPEKRMLRFLLETHQASAAMMQELAKLLAGFHHKAERIPIDPEDYASTLERQWNENLTELKTFLDRNADREALKAIKNAGSDFIAVHQDLLMRRAIEGWIRDVHGDLHAEHICFAPEGIQIFDRIEFSAKLRRCDLASEIAFLLMDLTVRGDESLRLPFLSQYRESLPDPDMPLLLPFFECYRALVRAKVHALRVGRWNDEAARYFRVAQRFTWARFKPFLVMICGFSGSGKSTLARALSERLDLPVYNSDVIRKKLSGIGGRRRVVKLNQDIYRPGITEKTYASLAREAEKQILMGNGAILDATFVRKSHRQRIAQLAAKHKISLLAIHCRISDDIAEKRLRLRAAQGMDVSDARWATYRAQKTAYEAMQEFRPGSVLELDTSAPLEELVCHCEKFLRSRVT
jgi:aminoglycoside phosphotransferase family enzyme/predicted kinase